MQYKSVILSISLVIFINVAYSQNRETINEINSVWVQKFYNKDFGRNVFVFDPEMKMTEIQALIDSVYLLQHPRSSEFGENRFAFMFKPGTYNLDIKIGYYTSIIGLGESPEDVIIKGILLSKGESHGNVTCNFWRSVENITIAPPAGKLNIWGVSQAAPMRRTHIIGSIQLHDNGWASGGFLADSKVDDTIFAGGQQQWLTRNSDIGKWDRGSWNMMFIGVANAPEDKWPDNPYTVIDKTPIIREKPFLVIQGSEYLLKVPQIKRNSYGISWEGRSDIDDVYPLQDFYIANPEIDNASSLNSALSGGKNIFFLPGIYKLDESLKITRTGAVMAGIGMATLKSVNGNPVIEIADVDGVTLSGFIIDAGEAESKTLVRVGDSVSGISHAGNPTLLFDIFFRVGGYGKGKSSSCMIVNSNNVVIDHTWLWRADHGNNVGWDQNITKNGLIVNGNDVTVYGLFCEHFHEYQTLWNGNNGRVYFYQSEMPYDTPTAEAFNHGTTRGYASYKVSDNVTTHEAWALGIYCVFFKAPVIVDQAIETPPSLEDEIHHKIIYWLYGGNKESKIMSVINGKGGYVDVNNVKVVME